jgi:hypothetical protein
MITLKPHITAMKEPFSAALSIIFDALHHPGTLTGESAPDSLPSGLDRLVDAKTELVQSLDALNHTVFQAATCGESIQAGLSARFTQAVRKMVAAYADSIGLIQAIPGQPSVSLERMARANLERLAMWLSDILTTLVDPERLSHEAATDENHHERRHKLYFDFPDAVAGLENRVEIPTGYDAGLVRDTLIAARALPGGSRPPALPPPTPSRKSGLGFLGIVGAVFLGEALFDGLFGDDGDA